MPLLKPTVVFKRVTAITPQYLESHGIKALILDIDNTLTGHGSQKLPDDVSNWLETMRGAGIKMMVASNNFEKRVKPFADRIGLDFTSFSCKPAPFGLMRARKEMGVSKNEIALVGDQIFTDALGANLYGIRMLLVVPMYEDTKPTIRLKRALEKPVLKSYYKKGGKLI